MKRIIDTITGEGFVCVIEEDTETGLVTFVADADIDADGANGQKDIKLAAYLRGNKGLEDLANGGMKMKEGRVVGASSWFDDIVIVGKDGNPLQFPHGLIASKTAYRYPNTDKDDPFAYVDSATVDYIVVPPVIIQRTKGAVLGCQAWAEHIKTKVKVSAVVADVGPRRKSGEVSIALARALGIPSSPRSGGINAPLIRYTLAPGIPAEIGGQRFALQRSNGAHIPLVSSRVA